jgi:hypothetical protein
VAGADLYGLVSSVAAGGSGAQWLGFHIDELAGRDADHVIAILVNALYTPSGAPDDEAIRQGLYQALSMCLQNEEIFDPGALSQEMIGELLTTYLAEEIFLRVMNDSGQASNRTEDPLRQIEAEDEVRQLIFSVVDVIAGPVLQGENLHLDALRMQDLLRTTLQAVFTEFEGY